MHAEIVSAEQKRLYDIESVSAEYTTRIASRLDFKSIIEEGCKALEYLLHIKSFVGLCSLTCL